MRDVDAAARSLRLIGKGADSTGSSARRWTSRRGSKRPADGSSKLVGTSEMTVSGKAAAFGGRMMNSVADQILVQFAANFARAASSARRRAPARSEAAAAPGAPRRGADRELNGARDRLGGLQGLAARPRSASAR